MQQPTKETTETLALELLAGTADGAIERQEARGQANLVLTQVLPTNMHGNRAVLEAWGITFGEPFPNDPLFCPAQLPDGWRKVATDHRMWTDLVDARGLKRASIFYKAAAYDREAFVQPQPRYRVVKDLTRSSWLANTVASHVIDSNGHILFESSVHQYLPREGDSKEAYKAYQQHYDQVVHAAFYESEKWLNEHYPHWRDPLAYWDA
jgi:hypothetical protein